MGHGTRASFAVLAVVATLFAGCGSGPPSASGTAGTSPTSTAAASVGSEGPSSAATPNASDLAQPLHLPSVAAGAACPQSVLRVLSPALPPALGPGPVTPTGPFTNGVLTTTPLGSLHSAQLLWVVAPAYQGPALVRGRKLSGTGTVRFGTGTVPTSNQLWLPPGQGTSVPGAPGWRTWSILIGLPSPGCYGFQVDGVGFSTVILFEAS